MTEEEFRNYLHSAKRCKKEINSLRQSWKALEVEFLDFTSAGAMDYSVDRVQSSSEPDALLINAIDRVSEKRHKILLRIEELQKQIDDIEGTIDTVEDSICHEIMRLYYIEDVRMMDIADRLSFSEQRIWQLWRKGIEEAYSNIRVN